MVSGLSELKAPSKLCKDYMVGKQQRYTFPKKSTWKASRRLQLVHADICGPIKPISNSKKSEESKAYILYDPASRKIIVSRDVVFEEDKSWDWDKSHEEAIIADFEWGDSEVEAAVIDDNEEDNEDDFNGDIEGGVDNSSLDEPIEESSLSSNEGRNRRPPIWMRDYESGEGLSGEEDVANLAMFAAADPISYEDAMRYFLGIEVMQSSDGIYISQRKYALEVLERFGMDKSNPVHNPIVPGAVSWSLRKQPVVTLSTTKAEFIAAASCACQAVWLRRILEKLSHTQSKSTTVYCDNSSAIKLSKNLVMHGRSKHIDVRFHFLRELTKAETVMMVHCNTKEQVADVVTKPLKFDAFLKLRKLLGVCPVPSVN
ncbi:hypothetical protein MRB53_006019 [Persea americana]|uniref:Uncharacterized protein n=1 Tax=Persea americana TaxID=3435 RepID=A0ACC2MFU7_PERAE|nr:hypothetical protein MRB53_006019 [Persea americana]